MIGSQSFDLAGDRWLKRSEFGRRYRKLWLGATTFVAILLAVSSYAALRDYPSGGPHFFSALGLAMVFIWVFLTSLFQVAYVVGDPPTLLRINDVGLELEYARRGVRFRRAWADPKLLILLRDFRGWPTPVASDLVLDTGDRGVIRNLFPSVRPPSALLTEEAFNALLASARKQNLDITSHKEIGWRAGPGWVWPNTTTRVTHHA